MIEGQNEKIFDNHGQNELTNANSSNSKATDQTDFGSCKPALHLHALRGQEASVASFQLT